MLVHEKAHSSFQEGATDAGPGGGCKRYAGTHERKGCFGGAIK